MRQREHCDLVAASVQILDGGVVGVLVGYEVCSSDLTAIRIVAEAVEYFVVKVDVVDVHGSVESEGDHLGDIGWFQCAWNPGAVG